jgi:uncharacterized protein (DUF1499 family)
MPTAIRFTLLVRSIHHAATSEGNSSLSKSWTIAVGTLLAIAVLILIRLRLQVATPAAALGLVNGRLAVCLPTYNCVSSDAPDGPRSIDPLPLEGSASETWKHAVEIVESMPRTRIVSRTDEYVHAEIRMPIIPFVDDLELLLLPDEGVIAVRSASRAGKADLGVNRRRVERLRRGLIG